MGYHFIMLYSLVRIDRATCLRKWTQYHVLYYSILQNSSFLWNNISQINVYDMQLIGQFRYIPESGQFILYVLYWIAEGQMPKWQKLLNTRRSNIHFDRKYWIPEGQIPILIENTEYQKVKCPCDRKYWIPEGKKPMWQKILNTRRSNAHVTENTEYQKVKCPCDRKYKTAYVYRNVCVLWGFFSAQL